MGKVGGATPAKKKKGRPSLVDLKKRALEQKELQNHLQSHRRSTRRNPKSDATIADDAEDDDYYDEDDDDERQEKKVKLVVRLPQLDQQQHLVRSSSANSASCGSDSNADVDNRQINSGSAAILTHHQDEKVPKAMGTSHGSPLETGPTTPLPDKKLLLFILDRLQKKDTHAVFSEPVDPEELPDYHEVIQQPMDFGTIRSKLNKGLYSSLEELEADVNLLCSNAMQYNSSDTVFYRQAKAIQELARRDFENLRQEGEDGELQPKVVRRGRPPSKHLKKPPGRPSSDGVTVGHESTSAVTVVNTLDNTNESTPYNLRRGPMVNKNYADSLFPTHRTRNGEHSELLSDWNEEFPARIKRADMKYGSKHVIVDETRRDTYKQFHPLSYANSHSLSTNFGGEGNQLLAVGVHAEHGYSRSLARFAANMGPVVWEIASRKIQKALPPGVPFGPGFVGEPESRAPATSFFPSGNYSYAPGSGSNGVLNKPENPSTSGPKIEDSGAKMNKYTPRDGKKDFNVGSASGSSLSEPGMFQSHGPTVDAQVTTSQTGNPGNPNWQQVASLGHRQSTVSGMIQVPVSANLNVVGSRGPGAGYGGLKMGSPQQPDLALQL